MLRTPEETLSTAQDEQGTDSVYDFLFHDGRRIASILAQLDPSGHLTQVSKSTAAKRGKDEISTIDAKAGIPGVAQIKNDNSTKITHSREDEVLRVYDPTWSNARELLDLLSLRGLIERDLTKAHLGQIVLCSGGLSFLDLKMVQSSWGMKSVQALIRAGVPPQTGKSRSERRKGGALGTSTPATFDQTSFFLEMIPHFPHGIQVSLTGKERVWCTLDETGLSGESSHITLKHGVAVPGEWSILGVLDAKPDHSGGVGQAHGQSVDGEDLVANLAKTLAPIMRLFVGRPADAYGVTPLLLFRKVG